MIKIKKKRKTTWLHKLSRFITNWRTLCKERSFNWSFVKYFWQITVLNNYDVIRIKNNKQVVCLLFITKFKAENHIDLQIIMRAKTILLAPALQKIKNNIESYRASGYEIVEATILDYNKEILRLYINELGFEENKSKLLENKIKNNTNTTTVIKFLTNE